MSPVKDETYYVVLGHLGELSREDVLVDNESRMIEINQHLDGHYDMKR